MTAIADPRAPRVAARRRAGNLEKWGWIYMRVSGVLLIVLIFGHLFVNLMVGEGIHGVDFAFVAGKYAEPFWQWWDVTMLWLALIHGTNGMRTIVNDYVGREGIRKTLIVILWGVAAFLIALGTWVSFSFDPCVSFDPATASDTITSICSGR